jgi:hypothetical protein
MSFTKSRSNLRHIPAPPEGFAVLGLLGLGNFCWFLVIKIKPAQTTRTMKRSEMRVLCTNQQHHRPNMAAHIIRMLVVCFCLMQAALVLCSMVAICSKQQTCHLFVIAAAHEKKLRTLLIFLCFVVSHCIMCSGLRCDHWFLLSPYTPSVSFSVASIGSHCSRTDPIAQEQRRTFSYFGLRNNPHHFFLFFFLDPPLISYNYPYHPDMYSAELLGLSSCRK